MQPQVRRLCRSSSSWRRWSRRSAWPVGSRSSSGRGRSGCARRALECCAWRCAARGPLASAR